MKRFLVGILLTLALGIPALGQQLLKQSTATTINIGPFIDDTDFKTLETALTVTSMTVKVIKHSDTESVTVTSFSPTAGPAGGANDARHVASGMYNLELTTTNTDTLGRLEVVTTITGALPVFHRFEVVGSTPYETQVTSTASIDDLNETDCSTIASTTSPMGLICANLNGKIKDYSSIKNKTTIATLASQTSFTLTAGSGDDNAYNGWLIYVQDQTTAEQFAAGVVQAYTGSTKTVTLRTDPAVFTMATGDIVYLQPDRSLKSTVDNRSLDVTSTGGAGVDWANVEAPTTTLALTGTTISTSQVVASVSGAVGSVTGSVGSLTTNNDKTGYALSSTGFDQVAAGSTGAQALTDAVWNEGIAGHLAGGSTGLALNSAGSAGDPWATALPGAYGAGTAGKIIGDKLFSVASGGITSASISADAFTASKFASDVGNEFGTSLLDLSNGVESGFTLRAIMRIISSVLIGKASGFDLNTPTFRDLNDTKNRVISTTNATGRTSVTLDTN